MPPLSYLPPTVTLQFSRLRRFRARKALQRSKLCVHVCDCWRHFECTGAENAAPKSAAYSGLWQVFYSLLQFSLRLKHY